MKNLNLLNLVRRRKTNNLSIRLKFDLNAQLNVMQDYKVDGIHFADSNRE